MPLRTGLRVLGLLVLVCSLAGCSTLREARGGPGQRLDPWENWNRKVFAFNEGLDENVLKPVATVYSNVVPQLVRQGVDNFFGNAADGWSAVNNFLQGKIVLGFQDSIRVGTNTLFGIVGLFDVASELGIERHNEDFGQTLGQWGVGPGAYVVWPVLGPSTVRESVALPLDIAASPALLFNDGGAKYSITALRLVNARANLLGASRLLDDIALDKYTFIRDAYLQRRRSLVLDGEEPPQDRSDAPEPSAVAPASAASPASPPASSPAK
jgi:phospholipid-binding lipoprotein MlaA